MDNAYGTKTWYVLASLACTLVPRESLQACDAPWPSAHPELTLFYRDPPGVGDARAPWYQCLQVTAGLTCGGTDPPRGHLALRV